MPARRSRPAVPVRQPPDGNSPAMNDQVISRAVLVSNPTGLHMRPASLFARCAAGFQSRIELSRETGDDPVDGKSMLSILTLAVECGTTIRISAVGSDAPAAVETLAALVARDFDLPTE